MKIQKELQRETSEDYYGEDNEERLKDTNKKERQNLGKY